MTEVELLAAVAEGDMGALRELHRLHAPWLAERLSRRSFDHTLVDEVLQDTFVTVWRKAATYRGEGDVGAWMWSIAIRKLIDRLRRKPFPWVDVSPHVRSAEEAVLDGVGYGDLGQALQSLSPELLAVVEATILEGLTAREASVLLEIPVGTVKTRLMRAKKVLREQVT